MIKFPSAKKFKRLKEDRYQYATHSYEYEINLSPPRPTCDELPAILQRITNELIGFFTLQNIAEILICLQIVLLVKKLTHTHFRRISHVRQ